MYPFGLPFGGSVAHEEEDLTVDSSKEDLWEEITELREKLKLMESGKMAAERKLELIINSLPFEGKPILVVRGIESYDDLQELAKFWMTRSPKGAVFAVPSDLKLEEMNDADLAQIGLRRVSTGPITERDSYEDMLRGC